jgi:glutaredoxin-like protein NrdH
MPLSVVVYTKPECVQCTYTVKMLEEHANKHPKAIVYETKDITTDQAAKAVVEETGRRELPYVVAGDQSWHGFNIDKLRDLPR